MLYENITTHIISCAFDIRQKYDRFMLESFDEQVMEIELLSRGLKVERQVGIDIEHKGNIIKRAYVADMVVNDCILLEFKALSRMGSNEFRQIMTYLTLMKMRLGFLINFGAKDFSFGKVESGMTLLDKGLYRIIN